MHSAIADVDVFFRRECFDDAVSVAVAVEDTVDDSVAGLYVGHAYDCAASKFQCAPARHWFFDAAHRSGSICGTPGWL